MKKLFYIIVFMITLFIGYNVVKGYYYSETTGSGGSGNVSVGCDGSTCVNIVNLIFKNPKVNKTFYFNNPSTAVYGMRMTIVDKNGNDIKSYKPINFWATDEMLQSIGYNSYMEALSTYTNMVDPTEKLWKYDGGSGKLRVLDGSDKNYFDLIKDLNIDDLEKYLKKFNISLDTAVSKNYYIKVEPIFVFHYVVDGKAHYYFRGTAREIITMIFTGKKINNNSIFKGRTRSDGASHQGLIKYIFYDDCQDEFMILNYLTTLYSQRNPNGSEICSICNNNLSNNVKTSCDTRRDIYDNIYKYKNSSKTDGLGVGFINIKDYAKYNLRIVKKYGNSLTKTDAFDSTAHFRLYNSKWSLVGEYSTKTSNGDQILDIKGLSKGDYYLCETNIQNASSLIKKVYFKMKKPSDYNVNNKYSLGLGSDEPHYPDGVQDLRACSNEFTINGDKLQKYIIVLNEKNNVPKITVVKKLGTYSPYGNTYSSYPHPSFYVLNYYNGKKYVRVDSNGSGDPKSLDANKAELSFSGNDLKNGDGRYQLCEVNINNQIVAVHFRLKNKGDDKGIYSIPKDDIVLSNSNRVACTEFDYNLSSGEKRVLVLNEPKDNSKLRITKKKGTEANSSKYTGIVKFSVCKANNRNDCIDITKNRNADYVEVDGSLLEPGVEYIIKEEVPANTSKVLFKYNDHNLGERTIEENNSEAISDSFTFVRNNKIQEIYVYNDSSSECDNLLKDITSRCTGGVCGSDIRSSVINELSELYETYSDYNLIQNYRYIDGGKLDVSQTSCGIAKCKINSSFECYEGSLSYYGDLVNYASSSSNRISEVYNSACYISDTSGTSDFVKYNYDDGNLVADCGVTYKYNLTKFDSNDSVQSGSLLWSGSINSDTKEKIGTLDINLQCNMITTLFVDNDSSDMTESQKDKEKTDFLNNLSLNISKLKDDLSPTFSISLDDLENISDEFDYNFSDTYSDITPDVKGCDNDYNCSAYWNSYFSLNIYYKSFWYLDKSFAFIRDSEYEKLKNDIHFNSNDYTPSGEGLPIATETKAATGLKATLSFTGAYTDTTLHNDAKCSYNVDNKCPDDDPSCYGAYNFDIRIIDTKDPFPGKSGKGRLTGENWCLSYRIGRKVKDINNNYLLVGDLNNDSMFTVSQDFGLNKDVFISKFNADIDGDGEVTYDDCSNEDNFESDNCILFNYINKNKTKICNSGNKIVKKYITDPDRPSSSSTDKPMYSFTLNSTDIKIIREYNKSYVYSDKNYTCINGNECIDKFLTNLIKGNPIINGKSISHPLNSDNSRCFDTRSQGNWCNNFDDEEVTN